MASLGGGLERSGERALATKGVGLEAITIEQGSALSTLSCWEAVKLSGGMFTASRAILTILLVFLIILEFVPWTQTISAQGQVSAYTPYDRPQKIESRITGRVKAWHIYEGVKVKKGDLIGELEDYDPTYMAPEILPLFEQRKDALGKTRQAALAKADQLSKRIGEMKKLVQAAVPSAEARVVEADNRIREAQQKVEAAKIDVDTAQLNVDRHRQLVRDGLVSQRELELTIQTEIGSKAALQAAQANLLAAEQGRSALNFGRDQITADVNQKLLDAVASRDAAVAEAAKATEQLADMSYKQQGVQQRIEAAQLYAPMDGTVVKMARVGINETVKQGDNLVTISPLASDPAIEMTAEGLDAPLLVPGRKVKILFFGVPAIPLPAWPGLMAGTRSGVIKVVDQIDDGKGNYRFWVVPDPEDSQPWPDQAQVRQGTRVLGWVILNRVPLWYELWRRFNFFPPDYMEREPSIFEMFAPRSAGQGIK
ncbi:MAG: biotin/lipoyl-binding protein [Nitrospira sp.]|nr:biotin/lipoyl-binding protein [Nitrospira sp.]MDH4368396.1 biotin/lipoyl-binding protein [Nitrospira sp.]MDH5348288.1 biotin/lipoyl-binding protein [Nitrospira sp.]MDH5497317.1 biotin/lipoyl-binding protein [Nitrospira sp.]MDH5725800.1 biotin/lipoyl-binding protein [Nitrospira sp.]